MEMETIDALGKIPAGTVSKQESELGVKHREPLLFSMDAMIRYAKAYQKAYGDPIGTDGVLGQEYAKVISGIRGLLNGQGGVAMEREMSGDSKDNGSIEDMYWKACELAKLDGDSL